MQLMKAALISSTVFVVMALPAHAAESGKKKGYGDNPNIFEVLGQKTLDTAQDAANAVDHSTQKGIAKVKPKVAETWNEAKTYSEEQTEIAKENSQKAAAKVNRKWHEAKASVLGDPNSPPAPIESHPLSQSSTTPAQNGQLN
ncbi:hypothetical protein [Acinetobacter sp. ANC 4173]|uniref:hypothetical protein n=1 Tax=Acinetobacter sp. ANC 4173 TaxID=2529837 RepID=UPI001040264F|nr:hypothetical protein [Acinetobacter sp. ANC 4173]TCB80034.1 hypothetical protein E0H94_09450 [Acinetobacter sp. ANC 4173]